MYLFFAPLQHPEKECLKGIIISQVLRIVWTIGLREQAGKDCFYFAKQ